MKNDPRFPSRLICAVFALALVTPVSADFRFNFNRVGGAADAFEGGFNPTGSVTDGNDGTRFHQEVINVDGVDYIHVIVGDPALGFAQESYTASVVDRAIGNYFSINATRRPYSAHSGGNERLLMGDFSTNQASMQDLDDQGRFGNAAFPFGQRYSPSKADADAGTSLPLPVDQRYRISGIGTMDPSRVVLRLSMSDADISMEVFKPFLARKPKVTQTLVDGVLVSEFSADMRGLTYDDGNRAGPVVNRLTMNDPDLPGNGAGASFDMSLAQRPYITAGRYIFSRVGRFASVTDPVTSDETILGGYGWQQAGGWNASGSVFNPGVYSYYDEGFDPLTVNWLRYFDPAQN